MTTRAEPSLARVIFLDRDGVINENRADYVKSWDEFQFIDGAREALARLARSDFKIVITTNQSAIGRRLITREIVDEIHRRMLDEISQTGGRVDRILYCPHRPEDGCRCRKPRPGLLIQARDELGLDLNESYLIGDSTEDVRAGLAVGCTTLLVLTGRGRQALLNLQEVDGAQPIVVENLADAVNTILQREQAIIDRATR